MEYPQEAFYTLMDRAADQGAEHLDAVCVPRRFKLTGKRRVERNGPIEGCGHSALFSLPYEGENDEEMNITLCAVDDAMGAMPRFGGDVLAKLSQAELFFLHGDRLLKHDPRVNG